jgi:hypothetical protein
MINSKITKQATQQTSEEKLFKLLESIDWKLWEMYNMMKKELDPKNGVKKPTAKKPVNNTEEE